MTEQTKSSVWLRTQSGLIKKLHEKLDQTAWDEFYQMYWRVIYGYAKQAGLSSSDAEDIVQQTMITVLRQLPSFEYDRAKGRFLSWLKTVTRSKTLNFFRHRSARIEGGHQVITEDNCKEPFDGPDKNPANIMTCDPWQDEWEQSALAIALERVGRQVEPKTFEAFRLYALESKSAEEVAKMLGLQPNAVYVYKNRVIQMLKKEVAEIRKTI